MLKLAFALALVAGGAAAQTSSLLPGIAPDERERFRICRAAIFFHLAPEARSQLVPPAVAEALRRQVSFIMYETLRNAPGASLADAKATIDFAENFFISFSVTMREQQSLQDDVAARERVLIDCVPRIWNIVTEHIDPLMTLRDREPAR